MNILQLRPLPYYSNRLLAMDVFQVFILTYKQRRY